MPHRQQALWGLLVVMGLCASVSAESPPRLKASREESREEWRDRVELVSPDGRSLVTKDGKEHRLREAETGEVRAVLAPELHHDPGLRFSPDGRFLFAKVSSQEYQPVNVVDLYAWDVATGRIYGTIPYVAEAVSATAMAPFVLSPDGTLLATPDNSQRLPMQVEAHTVGFNSTSLESHININPGLPRVKIWSVPAWKEVARVDGGPPMVFSPDGSVLATGCRDWRTPRIKIWNAGTWSLLEEIETGDQGVRPMTFSPDGKLLAVAGRDHATLWDLSARKKWTVSARNGGHRLPVFTPEGGLLFPNGLPSGNMNVEFPCYDVSSSPPRRLELGKGEYVVSPLTLKEPRLLVSPRAMRYVDFSGADDQDERTYEVRSLPDRRLLARSTVKGLIRARFSPDGGWIALLVGRRETGAYLRSIQLVDSASARLAADIPAPEDVWGDPGFKFSRDGESLVVRYHRGSNTYRPGEVAPEDRPRIVEQWELRPR